MKAIRTYYLPMTNHKPQRIVATTGERGQKLCLSTFSCEDKARASGVYIGNPHQMAARLLCRRYNWDKELIGGGFPDGSMVWVFNDPQNLDRA